MLRCAGLSRIFLEMLTAIALLPFFSFRKFPDTGDSEYRICALATVDKKISQIEIWKDKSHRKFRRYFNLLIRPSRSKHNAWEHFEPTLHGSRLHHDWLWRMAEHQGFRKRDFKALEARDLLEKHATIRHHPLIIAKNYVLFSTDAAKTHILSKPAVVAWHSKGKPNEEWNKDRFSQAVQKLTLDVAEKANGRKRSLRIKNSQRAHRHIVFELPNDEAYRWRTQFLDLIRDQ